MLKVDAEKTTYLDALNELDEITRERTAMRECTGDCKTRTPHGKVRWAEYRLVGLQKRVVIHVCEKPS